MKKKKDILKELIPIILIESGQLKKNSIKEKSLKKSEDLDLISPNLLHEVLTDLMKDGIIEIVDYDFGIYGDIKQIQSIKSEGLVFDVVKTSPMEICALLEELNCKEPKKVIKANKKLKRQFRRKYKEHENILIRRWVKKTQRTYEYTPDKLLDILPSELEKHRDNKDDRLKNLKIKIKSLDGGKIWFYNRFGMQKPSPEELLRYCKFVFDEEGTMDLEKVLNSLEYFKPVKKDNTYIDTLFDEIIVYIQFDSEYDKRKDLMIKMAKGLSDIKESYLVFEELIDVTNQLLEEKEESLSIMEIEKEIN